MPVDKSLVKKAAKGNWAKIYGFLLPQLSAAMENPRVHHPCPFHNGKDGFRFFKDWEESGACICATCGPPQSKGAFTNGFNLLMWKHGWDFPRVMEEVYEVLGRPDEPPSNVDDSYTVPKMTDEEKATNRERIKRVLKGSQSLHLPGAERSIEYLQSRYIQPVFGELSDVRFKHRVGYYLTPKKKNERHKYIGNYPAMLAIIRDPKGRAIGLHRTYLDPVGPGRADLEKTKKLMSPCDELTGSAIRLGPVAHHIGIAEGIETALAVRQLYGIPCWSAIAAALLAQFRPPKGVTHVTIFADKDLSKAGLNAALALANDLRNLGYIVNIKLPNLPIPKGHKSVDFADVLRYVVEKGVYHAA